MGFIYINRYTTELHCNKNIFLYSCFLLTLNDDTIKGIYGTLKKCALISKYAGGIGINVHCIRAKGTNDAYDTDATNGLISVLKLYNDIAVYVDQGGNKRPGAFAIYLEPWHADIFDFLELKRNIGNLFVFLLYVTWNEMRG